MPVRPDDIVFATAVEDPVEPKLDPNEVFATEGEQPKRQKTHIPLRNKLLAATGFLAAVFALYAAIDNIDIRSSTGAISLPPASVAGDVVAPPTDSLGVQFSEIRGLWNAIEQPPAITTALRRLPETGELDSFLHRFDASAELVGAYQDGTDYLVAILARARLSHPDVSNLYLHTCHMIHPYSPGCIDGYFDSGLAGLTLEEAGAQGIDTTWEFEANTWRLTIEDGWLTIRVIAPDAG